MAFHTYEPSAGHGLAHDPFNAIVGPRPIGWISTRSQSGILNLAPYSFFNAFNYKPPIVGFSSIGWKDSVQNIQDTGEFGWNLATRALAEQMNLTSGNHAPDVDEFSIAGLTPAPGIRTATPRVMESPVSFECSLIEIIQLKTAAGAAVDSWLVLGEVVAVHIDDRFIDAGVYQMERTEPILRAGGPSQYYGIEPAAGFHMKRPS